MRQCSALFSLCLVLSTLVHAQQPASEPKSVPAATPAPLWAGPADPKAQKSYEEGRGLELHYHYTNASDSYRRADKQDSNRCAACALKVVQLAATTHDFNQAEAAAQELIGLAVTPRQKAAAHVARAQMLSSMGTVKKKPEFFSEGLQEAEAALASQPGDATALYVKGTCLAHAQQDGAAREVFTALLPKLAPHSVDRSRVARYAERP